MYRIIQTSTFLVFIILLSSTGNCKVIGINDDFQGKEIDKSLWIIQSASGSIYQNDKLVFDTGFQENCWQEFVYTAKSIPRVKEGKAARLTLDLKLSEFAIYLLGFCAESPDGILVSPQAGMKYGYHGHRLDRALWFMEGADFDQLLRVAAHDQEYEKYRLRLELGKNNGALWMYDFGEGWRVARDTRSDGSGDCDDSYRFFISTCGGTLKVDNFLVEYVDPSELREQDVPQWGKPVSTEFNGKMDEGWTNWAGTMGAWWAELSTSDFTSAPGWLVLHGPKGGFGLHLRHYPFIAGNTFPFYMETHFRYPTIDPPEGNYMIMLSLLMDMDADLLTDDITYPSIILQNVDGKTFIRSDFLSSGLNDVDISGCRSGEIALSEPWIKGDFFLRIGLVDARQMIFEYRRNEKDNWNTIHRFIATGKLKSVGIPIACDLIGPCADSNWPMPPKPQCEADEVSFEIDYVRFYSKEVSQE